GGHRGEQRALLPLQDQQQGPGVSGVVLLGEAEVARSGALADAVEQARPEPPPPFVIRANVEGTGAELEYSLEHLDRRPQAPGTGEGSVQLDPAAAGLACELQPGGVLPDVD